MEEIMIEKVDLQFRLKKINDGVVPDSSNNSIFDRLGLHLGECLGGGEFSKVFRAQWKKEKKDVALKIIKKSRLPVEYLENNLPDQLFGLQKTQTHPLVVDIFAVYESPKAFYLMFEYLPMGNLLDYVNKRGFLGEAESRKFFRQLIDVIDYCHQEGIVHGDVKLDNILLDQYFNIRVCDFEYCTILHSENATCVVDSGSMLYAAPEVYTKKSYDGIKADIWSMGICLYGMLCGRLPFNIPDPDVYIRIVQEKIKFTRLLSTNCRRLIRNIIMVNTNQRFQMSEIRRSPWLSQPINVDSPGEYDAGTSSPALISPSGSQALDTSTAEAGFGHISARKVEARARFVSGVLRAVASRKWASGSTQQPVLRKDSLLTIGEPDELNEHTIGYGLKLPTKVIHDVRMVHMPDTKMLESLRKSDASTLNKELKKLKFSTAGKMARMTKVIIGKAKQDTTLTQNVRFKAAVLRVQRELLGNWHVACRNMLTCASTFKKELEDKLEKKDGQRRMSVNDK